MKITTIRLHGGDPPIPVVVAVRDLQSEATGSFIRNLWRCTDLPLKLHIIQGPSSEFNYGRYYNEGIRSTEPSEFIIGMDDDVFPQAECLERMLKYIEADPRLGYVGAKLLIKDLPPMAGWYSQGVLDFMAGYLAAGAPFNGLKKLLGGEWHSFRCGLAKNHYPGKMIGCPSTLFVIRRRCFEDVGPFDDYYRLGYGDNDYAYRVLTSDKWFMSTCLEAKAFHDWHSTRNFDLNSPDGKHFREVWNRERMRAVRRAAREGKFICNGV